MPTIPDWIQRELRCVDPNLSVRWHPCRGRGRDHAGCDRSWSGVRLCDVYVVWRRIRDTGEMDRFGRRFFGSDWSGPFPERIPVIVIPATETLDARLVLAIRAGYRASEDPRDIQRLILQRLEREQRERQKAGREFWEERTEGYAKLLRDWKDWKDVSELFKRRGKG